MSPTQRDTALSQDGLPEGGLDRAAAILGAFDATHGSSRWPRWSPGAGCPARPRTGPPTG